MKIAILGYGTEGKSLVDMIDNNKEKNIRIYKYLCRLL